MKYIISLVAMFCMAAGTALAAYVSFGVNGVSTFLPADRLVTLNWQNSGMQSLGGPSGAGIPVRNTICSTLSPLGGTSDDTAQINSAIASCTAGQVVLLNPGTFIVNSTFIAITKGITLRGSGAGVTTLYQTVGGLPRTSANESGTNGIKTPANFGNYAGGIAATTPTFTNGSASIGVTSNPFYVGSLVKFTNSGGALPSPLAAGTNYYVVSTGYSTSAMQVATLPWGSPITMTSAGSGTQSVSAPAVNLAVVGINIGPSAFPEPDVNASLALTADAVKGSSSITVANGSSFATGQFVLIDEATVGSWQPTPANFPSSATQWQGDRVLWSMHDPVVTGDANSGASAAGPYAIATSFTASVTSGTLNVTSVSSGSIAIGQTITDAGNNVLGTIFGGSGSTWTFLNSTLTVGSQTMNGGVQPAQMSWFTRQDRPTAEMKEVASVSGNVISFTSPIMLPYRVSHGAQATQFIRNGDGFHPSLQVTLAGIENMTLTGFGNNAIQFSSAAYSWVKNVEITQWLGLGLVINNSFRIEIRDSYIHTGSWPVPGGGGYAIGVQFGSSEVLVENNIFLDANKVMIVKGAGAGSVFGYNYADDGWIFGTDTFVEVGLNASHNATPHHVLYEGNYGFNADSDYTWGNSIYLTFFRNWMTGQRRDFTDSSFGRTVGLGYGSWWDSFVGNVLGYSSRPSWVWSSGSTGTTGANGWAYNATAMSCDASGNNCTGNNATWNSPVIWTLGYDAAVSFVSNPDLTTINTVIRDGNFDYFTGTQRWHNTPATFTIPNSMYLPSMPAFFNTYSNTWPIVNPSTGSTSPNPALSRYNNGTPNAP